MNKIKESVEYMNNDFGEIGITRGASTADCHIQTLIQLAEDVIALDGMVEKKEMFEYGTDNDAEVLSINNLSRQFNEGREQTIKAVAGRMQGIYDILIEVYCKFHADTPEYHEELVQALRNHLLKEDV